ncbi:MAG TPA: hypothetical protein DCS78_12645 [Pseudoalteromonas shioyasakiensis]|nr:hypothetical protein [Pseudoalteromonas shioyasakiensis]|tara:strand:- start:234 stop:431 length:198 start_codon:yes stop_codon:yes gene_type:complete
MALEYLYTHWKSLFLANGFSEDVAKEEYQTWCEGLGGELDNEYQQTEFSVIMAAEEAIIELQQID